MVMEESTAVHSHSHSPTGENNLNVTNNNNSSPSSNVYLVGLEFVRQYYTVMNQGPLYLHRFYSDDSSFVHGVSARDSKVVYGQQEIHKRIQSLNFRNCHAKIRQVDSHETLGNGVVIQVTGELSNNGQPMRRFMQTFVLAPQSPKRYYVRNDIFHYQDEVFCDEDVQASPPVEANLETEEQEECEKELDAVNNITMVPVVDTSPLAAVAPKAAPMAEVITTINSKPGAPPVLNQPVPQPSPGPVNDAAGSAPVTTSSSAPVKVDGAQGKFNSGNAEAATPATNVSSGGPLSGAGDDGVSVVSINRVLEEETTVVNSGTSGSGPKTYANLFKSSSTISSVAATPVVNQAAAPAKTGTNGPVAGSTPGNNVTVSVNENAVTTSPQVSPQPPAANTRQNEKGLPPRNPRGPGGGGFNRERENRGGDRDRDQRGDRNDRDNRQNDRDRDRREPRERLPSRSSNALNVETGSVDGDRDRSRPVNTYSDAYQLFVGNLPHTVTLQEIKDIFSEFGDVADVKIQKPAPKSSGTKVPYFAFVVFEDPSSAQAALKKHKISMKMSDGTDRRLNVEEKRSRPPMGNSGGGNSYGFRDNVVNNAGHSVSSNHSGNNNAVGGGGGSGHGRNYSGGSYSDQQQQRPPPQTHSRTFRGSNRGGGNNTSGGDRSGRGPSGGGGGHNNNNSGNNSGSFQGGRTSPNRSYSNNKR
ncbi:unnamed protein product [Allacma fusca]|uniref:Ras GTPase-activating protein-binding protein 2 n=1 Tax=Allacma fusca TaxID=39272 RepID=A0A8J2KE71_9HEXA|nr:unnamed protein product [Allacma fusca]